MRVVFILINLKVCLMVERETKEGADVRIKFGGVATG